MDQQRAKKELQENAEKGIVGGRIVSGDQTRMVCQTPGCPYAITWDGNYLGQSFDCPRCTDHDIPPEQRLYKTLLGVEYFS